MLDPILVFGVMTAGGAGAIVRLICGKWRGMLPWGTLLANLLAGVVLGFTMGGHLAVWVTALLFSGFAGGLSTFSGVAAETGQLVMARKYLLAAGNLAANLLLPVLAVYLPVLALATLVN